MVNRQDSHNFNGDVRNYTAQKAKVLQSEFRRSTFLA